MKQKLFTLLTLLVLCVTGVWADDVTDTFTNIVYRNSDSDDTKAMGANVGISSLTLSGEATISSSCFQVGSSASGGFTVTTPTGYRIKTIQFSEKSSSKVSNLTCSDGGTDKISGPTSKVYTYTATTTINSVTFTWSGNGGNAQVNNVIVTMTNDDISAGLYEKISPTGSVSDNNIPFSSTLGDNKVITSLTQYNSASSGSSSIDFGQNKGFTITTDKAIKEVYFTWIQRAPTQDSDWGGYVPSSTTAVGETLGSFSKDANKWTAPNTSTKSVTFKRNVGKTAKVASIHIIYYDDLPSYNMTATVDDDTHGTATPSASSVQQGNSVTFTATENLGWKFTKWTNTSTGDDVSTDNPYTIASVSGDVSLTANYEAVTTYNVIISAGETGALGNYCDNKVITQNENTTVTLPAKNSWFYKEGYTATGWTDGTNDYAFGGTFTLTGNVTIYPKFRANTKAIGDANATVTWNLTKPVSGPLHIEGTTGYFVTTAEVGGETIDVPMYWDNTSGKLDNRSRDTNNDCQVNGGSKFSIPAVKGMTVTLAASYAITATLDGNDMTATAASPFTATGTYTGTEDDVEVVINGGSWFQSITATYKVGYDAPTIVKGDFNFENKGYKVTITASEGTLNVSTDGTNYTEQTSPYETYATATTTYYAKATGADFNDSEVASLEVANSYDVSKNYVAYVYQKGYSDSSVDYDFATDELANGLAADYNVVPVELAQTDDPTAITDMDKADLIILTEAVKGSNTSTDLSNKMKEYVGTTPMIGMKVFAYTYNSDASKNRWGWGKASNQAGVNTFMPKDNTYKIFDGVVFEADGSIKLATATSGNIIQSVDFTTPETPLSPNTIMGTVGTDDKKAVIHTTTKYLGVGISCNVRESYTPNLIAIVKNAAAILIANGDLTAKADFAKKVTDTITVSGWNSFSSVFPLDLSTITATNEVGAYYASATSGSNVTMTPTDAIVEAGEGLMIKGTAGEDFMIDVATADADFAGTNLLKGLPNGGMVTKDNNNYVFAWPTEAPANCGFYLINDVEPTLPGGKAYLHTTTALTAHELTITFEGETTGISNINANDNANIDANAPMYNLAGQKVTKSYKGVVIVNGKKVVRK